MRIVETYGDSADTVTIEGRSYPAESLLEDDDGIRWYLTSSATLIDPRNWNNAAAGGASAILAASGAGILAQTTEQFMADRTEVQQGYVPGTLSWHAGPETPTYSNLAAGTYGQTYSTSSAGAGAVTFTMSTKANPEPGFVHLHTHSEYSSFDGMSMWPEIVEQVIAQGGTAIGSADHGICAGHPEQQKQAAKAGLTPVFGMEAYFVDDRFARLDQYVAPEGMDPKSEEGKAHREAFKAEVTDYYHLCLWATDQASLLRLWAMSTESYRTGFYSKPRLDWEVLEKYSEGIICSTACLRGPLVHKALIEGNEEVARARLSRLQRIFGDRLFVELHVNQLPEQLIVNEALVVLAREQGVGLLAAVDSHYATTEDRLPHRVWLSARTEDDIADDTELFSGQQDYHLKTETEVRANLAYLGTSVVDEACANTVRVAAMATAEVTGVPKPPIFSKGGKGTHEEDAERLLDLCLSNWHLTQGKRFDQSAYMERFEREFDLIKRKNFCGYFLMVAEQTNWAQSDGILVGPGRGSGGGSLVAYLARIVGIDAVDAELIFERFMTEGRTALPDFDIDYPQSKKQRVQQHARDRYGDDYVTVVGSVMRLKNKGIIKKLGAAMKSTLTNPEEYFLDAAAMSAIISDAEADTAGIGLAWPDLWDRVGEELQPYRDKYPQVFAMADRLVGRISGYGQHAAGLIISTDQPLTGQLPLRRASEEGHLIAQFDKDVIEELGFIKFDLLTLRNLDTIQMAVDLIRERRGITVNVNDWRDEYEDPQVWEEISEAHTLGIFQIETHSGTRMTKRMQPHSMAELADMITLVRPGPSKSGLTDTYLRRRDGEEPVTFPDPRMATVLAKTYGCLLYQEDIMQACIVLAGYDGNEADAVRKILGKKQVEKVAVAGQEFTTRAVAMGMDPTAAASLWAQMAEFAKYSFNRAHAFAYAVLGYWCAWLKFHYPVEFLTAALSTVDTDRVPDFIKEARRMGYAVLPPDINESGSGFRAGQMAVRYGLAQIKGIGLAGLKDILEHQPYTSFEDYLERKGPNADRGITATLARIGAFDSLVPNRRGLEFVLAAEKSGEASMCVDKVIGTIGAPNDLPCTFDWSKEEPPVNPRTKKLMKLKPPPKKCTKACRQYRARPPVDITTIEPYSDNDIRDIEQDLLGVYLSSTPFDDIPDDYREIFKDQHYAMDAKGSQDALYLLGGVLTKVRPHTDKSGRAMGFLDLETEVGTVSITCFNSTWEKYRPQLRRGALVMLEADKNSRGCSLYTIAPIAS